jgi:hypothetical protein
VDTEETEAGAGLLMQEKIKGKYSLQMGGWAGPRRSAALEVPRPQAFIGICR